MSTKPASSAYAVFRPRRGRWMALIAAAAAVVVFGIVAFNLPQGGVTGWTAVDAGALFVFGLAMATILWRFAAIKAVPTPDGLTVRNLLVNRDLAWEEIVGVQFGGGTPWLVLDLADTEQLAVMAVQRADAEFAVSEAERMAALVEAHGFQDPRVG
ncbi:PH domain-containing protein [Yimella sp. cx-573]|nr:PH domain-containing protein [Yimella sp. cx-573]